MLSLQLGAWTVSPSLSPPLTALPLTSPLLTSGGLGVFGLLMSSSLLGFGGVTAPVLPSITFVQGGFRQGGSRLRKGACVWSAAHCLPCVP